MSETKASTGSAGVGVAQASPSDSSGTWFQVTMPVRWSDCDPAGIVYYVNYYTFQEHATMEFLRSRNTTWRQLEEQSECHFPRVECQCRYMASCSYEDLLDVGITVAAMTSKIITLRFRVWRQPDHTELCDGHVKFAMVPRSVADGQRARAVTLPDPIRDLFAQLT